MSNSDSFKGILTKLYDFWNKLECLIIPSAQTEISSPLFHPTTFFNLISNKKINLMYLQPHVASKEFDNMRFGVQNYTFLKFQIVLKSNIKNPQKLVLDSLKYIGLDIENNDVYFKNENYESFIFRLNSCGYRILFNNISVAKLHYIQNVGTYNLNYTPITITYDIDKILTILQNKTNLWDVVWNNENNDIFYSDLMLNSETDNYEFIKDKTTNKIILEQLENFKNITKQLLEKDILVPAYITVLKAKYCLDILCLRNYIMYNDKLDYSKSLRDLVDMCCEKYLLKYREEKNV